MKYKSIFDLISSPEFLKYVSVGVITGLLLLGLTALFTDVFQIFYAISALIAYEICVICSFILNEKWTFTTQKTTKMRIRFVKYNSFLLISLGINLSILIFLTAVLGMYYLISEGIAILVAFVFNFTTSKKITFR